LISELQLSCTELFSKASCLKTVLPFACGQLAEVESKLATAQNQLVHFYTQFLQSGLLSLLGKEG